MLACGGGSSSPDATPVPPDAAPLPPDAAPVAQKKLYPDWVKSLELRRSVSVLKEPSDASVKIGNIAAGMRVRWRGVKVAKGCPKRWVNIEPFGWLCERHFRYSKKPPVTQEFPHLGRQEVVPGYYGKIHAEDAKVYRYENGRMVPIRDVEGSVTVRRYGVKTVTEEDGTTKRYWDMGGREYVRREDLYAHGPTRWHGQRIGDDTEWQLPMGFAAKHKHPKHKVAVFSKPKGGKWVRSIKMRTQVSILEELTNDKGEAKWYRIGENEWVMAQDIRVARKTKPPIGTLPNERWFDIYLPEQVMVAYEGERPVYATLISSGQMKYRTPTGIFRVFVKFAETKMSGQMGDEEAYSVATVPWTQYYAKDFALHTSYWHNNFGIGVSHGCVNLTPIDARFLYFWSDPVVPAGWSAAHGTDKHPGSLVRVRSEKDNDPFFYGYARKVLKRRLDKLGLPMPPKPPPFVSKEQELKMAAEEKKKLEELRAKKEAEKARLRGEDPDAKKDEAKAAKKDEAKKADAKKAEPKKPVKKGPTPEELAAMDLRRASKKKAPVKKPDPAKKPDPKPKK